MRPDKLNFLFNPVSIISGVGPKIETLIKKFLGDKIINLLWHLPYNITIRTKHETISKNEVNSDPYPAVPEASITGFLRHKSPTLVSSGES